MIVGDNVAIFIDDKSRSQALLLEVPVRNVTKKPSKKITERALFSRTEVMSEGVAGNTNRGGGADIDHSRSHLLGQFGKGLGKPDHLGFSFFLLLVTTGSKTDPTTKANDQE